MPEYKFEKFWGRTWSSVLNTLGILAVICFPFGMIWIVYNSPKDPPASVSSASNFDTTKADVEKQRVAAVRANFKRLLVLSDKPCALKGKKVSDVKNCSIFGLKLGDSFAVAKQTVDGSGFFTNPMTTIDMCDADKKNCRKFDYLKNEVFSLNINFIPFEGDDELRTISEITLVLNLALIPYMDAEAMLPAFLKIFGPPDDSRYHAISGDQYSDAPYIRAYSYKDSFWVILKYGQPEGKVE